MKQITHEKITEVIRIMDNHFGIEFDDIYIRSILHSNDELKQKVIDNTYFNTDVMNVFANFIAEDLVGCKWPDNPDTKFINKLRIEARHRGFSTIWD